jgi:hypothetical protein
MWKKLKPTDKAPAFADAARKSSPWHAVSIVSAGLSCAESLRLIDTRFLSRDAPRLPLAACAIAGECRCRFKHYEDRRGQPRRAEERGSFPGIGFVGSERRRQRGRRSTDAAGINDWKG